MKAIWDDKVWYVKDISGNDIHLLDIEDVIDAEDEGVEVVVSLSDRGLIIDPTDHELEIIGAL